MKAAGNSREVFSTQSGVNPRLEAVIASHLANEWQQPLHPPSVRAFDEVTKLLGGRPARLVLDSGCGTGESTGLLAQALPDCTVIGIDKSAARLSRNGAGVAPQLEGNRVLVRAELETFWRLAVRAGWHLHRHYLFYPNPWPKPGQLQRRWHAHPVFPELLKLGGRLEMRSNWEIYALEFAAAVNQVLGVQISPELVSAATAVTPFERKYRDSGHTLYSVTVSFERD